MGITVTRRDFLNGVALGTGGLVLNGCVDDKREGSVDGNAQSHPLSPAPPSTFTPPPPSTYYPPTLTGLRGSHVGSFEVAHALAWRGEKPAEYEELNEHYDLVVVGAGMSGLAAARFFQEEIGPDAKILVLDNHDDFGGHAKRNEFHQDGRMILSLGGAQNLENPNGYSKAASWLLYDIGIDKDFVEQMAAQTPDDMVLGGNMNASNGVALPTDSGHVTIGQNWNGTLFGGKDHAAFVRQLPIAEAEKLSLIAFFGGEKDFLDDLSLSEKWRYVNTTSYNRFLLERVGLASETLPILNASLLHLTGISGWNLTVLEAIGGAAPGIKSLGWLGKTAAKIGGALLDTILNVRMFPDGNASVARLLVQRMIPQVAPRMRGPHDVAITRFDYGALDQRENTVRLRLNSTVVGVREQESGNVIVDYVQTGKAQRVTADHCVLACYNALIPHLCPELPDSQKEGLRYGVKTPFVYANVQLANGRAYSKLDARFYQCPYDPFQWVSDAPRMTVGGYQPPRNPDDPMVVFMMHSPMSITDSDNSGSGRDQLRLGRSQIYSTPFANFEQQIRDQLQSLLGKHGFDHENDIRAITVNRIPHGYAYPYLALDDPQWEEGEAPHEIGRAQFGRISIANTDSEAVALMDAAFDAAWRAVKEQTAS